MDSGRDRWIAVGAALIVLALAGLIVATVLEAQRNGQKALERLQLSQVQQLSGELDSAVKQAFSGNTAVNAPPPWNLAPNDPTDARRLQLLQPPNARAGSVLIDRTGTIVNGVLLERATVGDKLVRPEIDRVLGPNPKPAVLPVAPGVTTSVPTTAFAYPLKNAAGQPIGAYVSETDVSPDSAFSAILKELRSGKTGQYIFVDDRGLIAGASDPTLNGTSVKPLGLTAHERPGFRHTGTHIIAVGDLPTIGWTAVFRQTASEFEGGLTGPLRSALLLLAVAAVLGGGLLFFFLLRRLRAAREEQRRLAEINAVREEFMSIVSHELRTPVTGLLGFLQTTLDHWDAMSDDDRRAALNRASTNARRLHALTRDVLDTASIESGELTYVFEVVDINAEVASAATAAQDLQPTRPISVDTPDEHVWVRADPERVQQILTNLLDNASKNSAPESPIEISVNGVDREVQVSVTDRGAGIPSDELSRVFDKFVRGRATDTRGTGLGLYICKRIVDAHGGRIWASSEPGGTTLTFALPLVPAPTEPPSTTAEPVGTPTD
ncbi:MAG TPA: sensor histidine kinase [Acidimicrobiales bacterium]|jgi:signal transduction histidine kinase|nr:sensor histidine kinase [Acidimicrobiales bacterium]